MKVVSGIMLIVTKITLFAALAMLAASVLVGCQTGTSSGTTGDLESTTTQTTPEATSEPVAYTKDGKLFCPIMKSEIASKEKAVGYVDHKGTRYYMCCQPCLDQAQKDPAILDKVTQS